MFSRLLKMSLRFFFTRCLRWSQKKPSCMGGIEWELDRHPHPYLAMDSKVTNPDGHFEQMGTSGGAFLYPKCNYFIWTFFCAKPRLVEVLAHQAVRCFFCLSIQSPQCQSASIQKGLIRDRTTQGAISCEPQRKA